MPDLVQALQSGATHLWLFIPMGVLLGALHGLEPGHSKTMMAAFIVAVRGTVGQAILLGLAAALSHSLVIWLLVGMVLYFGDQWNAETVEPYLQIGSAVCILGLAVWMFVRTRRELKAAHDHAHHHADHDHDHDHHHHHPGGHHHDHDHHAGDAMHSRVQDAAAPVEYQDAHERAHALEIEKRFAGRSVTTWQILVFGITGGLMPCPAAFTVLMVCLQLKRVALGFAMVAAFSAGLAITMMAAGALAAVSVRHAQKRFRGFGEWMRRAPYVSCVLLGILAIYMAYHGWRSLPGS